MQKVAFSIVSRSKDQFTAGRSNQRFAARVSLLEDERCEVRLFAP